jgi:CubicO group peptidase (beta-lactamase class C family)
MPHPSRFIVFVVAFALLSPTVLAATPIASTDIDATIERSMKTFDVPGIAVAVVKDDRIVYSKGFGVESLNGARKVDAHTLFGIASNSKAFVAAALAMLVDEKKLKWNDKVTDIIPEFKLYDPYVTAEFTVEDLLTHRSGLGLGAGDLMLFPDGSDFTRADVIRNLRYLKPVSGFRSKFDYDNLLYIVAGEVVARVSGMSWEGFVEQRIMRPLGMNESAASRSRAPAGSHLAMPHIASDGSPARQIDADLGNIANAAGGIVSNLADMSAWVRMQLNGGSYGNGQHLFSAQAQAAMWSPHAILPVRPGPYSSNFSTYGLGWFVNDANGYKVVTHTGGLTGMVTQVVLVPSLKLGVIVLTNQEQGSAFNAISSTILDSYLGVAPTDRVGELRKRRDERVAKAATEAAAARALPPGAAAGPAPIRRRSPEPGAIRGSVTSPSAGPALACFSPRSARPS